MQALDSAAIGTFGIPRLLLMAHAGLALARAVKLLAAPGAPVLICCGGGFNGGDGLAATRHLECAGYDVRVLLVVPRESLRSEPAAFAGIVERLVQVRDMAAAADLTNIAMRFAAVETMPSGEIGTNVIAALTWIQEKPEYPAITTQLAMVAMNLKNLK
jgi:hypothetical protein